MRRESVRQLGYGGDTKSPPLWISLPSANVYLEHTKEKQPGEAAGNDIYFFTVWA